VVGAQSNMAFLKKIVGEELDNELDTELVSERRC
jgi:hypothetical protein